MVSEDWSVRDRIFAVLLCVWIASICFCFGSSIGATGIRYWMGEAKELDRVVTSLGPGGPVMGVLGPFAALMAITIGLFCLYGGVLCIVGKEPAVAGSFAVGLPYFLAVGLPYFLAALWCTLMCVYDGELCEDVIGTGAAVIVVPLVLLIAIGLILQLLAQIPGLEHLHPDKW